MTREEVIKVLERAEGYAGIHYVNGVEYPYISPCLLKAIDFAVSALMEQKERESVWHDAKDNPPQKSGLYYGKRDDTDSMYLCQYRDGVWTLDAYPETRMHVIKWAYYNAFVQEQE